jgi:hypothetical protein
MATTISTVILAGMPTAETLDASVLPSLENRTIQHGATTSKIQLDASSTPPVSMLSSLRLAAASGTIDLTSLATTEGTRSASGLKLVGIYIRVNTAHALSIAVGASNGYAIGGNPIRVEPSGVVLHYFSAGLTAIDGTHKTLDYTFNAAGTADVVLILG